MSELIMILKEPDLLYQGGTFLWSDLWAKKNKSGSTSRWILAYYTTFRTRNEPKYVVNQGINFILSYYICKTKKLSSLQSLAI